VSWNTAPTGVDIQAVELVDLRIDTSKTEALSKIMKASIASIDAALNSQEPNGLNKRREAVEVLVADIKSKLGEKQRLFVIFKEHVAKWQRAKQDLLGSKDKAQSIEWFKAEIKSLDAMPIKLTTSLAGLSRQRSRLRLSKFSKALNLPSRTENRSTASSNLVSIRAKAEHHLLVIKCQFGHRKVHYQGLSKNTS
jgi:hypothetical protein